MCSVLLNLIFVYYGGSQESETEVRKPAVAGSFYPADPVNLKTQLAGFFEAVADKSPKKNIAALIVPHAGYVFSGEVAASAFAKLDPNQTWERIFLIGTSHRESLNGASVYKKGEFQTPLGNVKVDAETANKLIKENRNFSFIGAAHEREHSLEVQLPFLQFYLKKPFRIVPIIIGTQSAETCENIATALRPYFSGKNLFIISTDFSHYPGYADAVKYDKITGNAIASNNPEQFIDALLSNSKSKIQGLATSCCGWSSVLTLLYLTSEDPEVKFEHIKYQNSGDTPYGDKVQVVGYHSFIITRNNQQTGNYKLSEKSKRFLLETARRSIESGLKNKPLSIYDSADFPQDLLTPCGAFVTLEKSGKLRGCVGRFTANEPLWKVVQEMARAAAFQDTRFDPVRQTEMKDIEIEISVLTPLRKIKSVDEFDVKRHGIYMIKGTQSGTFLPQVAKETGWSREDLLGHCARDKAGIGWDGWKDAELYVYEALIFNEKEIKN